MRWHPGYRAAVAALEERWSALTATLAAGRRTEAPDACEELGQALLALDPGALFPVPDGAVELYLRRTLLDLDWAISSCRRRRFFELGYRLERAAASRRQAARLLVPYGLEP